jgi:hypothetical protein
MQLLPLFTHSSPDVQPSHTPVALAGFKDQSLSGVFAESQNVNVDSAFTEVVSGLNSATAQLVK